MFMRWRPIDEAHKEGITIWSDVSISNTFSLGCSRPDSSTAKQSLTEIQVSVVKVSKNRNDFMKTVLLPKSNEIVLRISLVFGRNDVFIKSFRFLLTFRIRNNINSQYTIKSECQVLYFDEIIAPQLEFACFKQFQSWPESSTPFFRYDIHISDLNQKCGFGH